MLTVQSLLHGDKNILNYYTKAEKMWEEIWSNPQSTNILGLARLLTLQQGNFEHECGGRYLGQEIMVWTDFMLLYDHSSGFNENKNKATMLRNAFEKSGCSIEIEGRLDEVLYYCPLEF